VAVLTRTILNIPEALGELALVIVVVACFVGLHAALQRRLSSEMLRRHNDVAGYLFSAVGVLYAVLLGFVVVVVWEKYDGTIANVQEEIDAAGDLYHIMVGFPEPVRSRVREDLSRYAQTVIYVEWPAMARNQDVPETGSRLIDDAAYNVNSFEPADQRGLNAQQAAINNEQRLLDARRQRLVRAQPAVPGILWFALVVGALAMVAFCYIFGVESRPAQLLMTAILVGLIAILFVVIAEFAGPFSGSVMISSEGWSTLAGRLPFIP
jgi:tryptophan-rich sensory protein